MLVCRETRKPFCGFVNLFFVTIKFLQIYLYFRSLICIFAGVNMTKRRYFASWLLLAVFVPMLVFSSLHIHEEINSQTETECNDCLHHSCHGHLVQTASWAHECVLCQFLTLPMMTAAAIAVLIYVHVCKKNLAQPLCSYHVACCGNIVTRGPPVGGKRSKV